jgi:kynurenine formamidase
MNKEKKGRTRIIDLSVALKNGPQDITAPKITYRTHAEEAKAAVGYFGLKESDFPDGKFAAIEIITLASHAGTHLDAPLHFGPMTAGKPAKTIDEIPLEWCYGDGVVLDLTHKKKGESISVSDIKAALSKINYRIKPYDIVLIRTDTDKHIDEPDYENMHAGVSREATSWLIDQGVKIMGIDAWGWDRPFDVMVAECKAGKKDQLWESHYLGKEKEYCHIEKLANLDKIPKPYGFKVAVFPVKIEKGSGGWVRAVAIIEEKE